MATIAQLVRALDCGSKCRGFEPRWSPHLIPIDNVSRMNTWEAVILGVIQGITEFFPISSSGHLELAQYFLGFQHLDRLILFNLICHLGTLIAILWVFFPQIKSSFTNDRATFWAVVIGTLPLFPLVLIMKPIKALFDQPQYLGYFFLLTSALLFISLANPPKLSLKPKTRRWSDPLTIGIFQAVAILPGVSRSGATITAGRLLGWEMSQAIPFSFMLAIPAILGGTVLETYQWWKTPSAMQSIDNVFPYLIAFAASLFAGIIALRTLVRMIQQDRWIYFAWYCLLLGVTLTLYFTLGAHV